MGQSDPSPADGGATGRTGPSHAAARAWYLSPPAVITAALLVIAVAAGAVYAATRHSGPSPAEKQAAAAAAALRSAQARQAADQAEAMVLAAHVSITPSTGSTGVALDSPVKVAAPGGSVQSVTVSGGGTAVPGTFDAAQGEWTPTAGLASGTAYTVTIVVAFDGVKVTRTTSFTTLVPVATVQASVYPSEGTTVGVGEPVVVSFDQPIESPAARAAIVARFTVAMGDPQPGGWYWFSDEDLHFRPESFWSAHQAVQVTADLNGIDLGGGVWTAGSIDDTFSIGDARVSYANLQTEVMTVTLNGATVDRFPISAGSSEYPTMNGIHIVLDKEPVVHMVSSTVGIPVDSPEGYDEYVYDDVHISQSGEYVHAAPWSVYAQGVENVSHGCINVSPANALTFYNFSEVGDVVEVAGSIRPPLTSDEGVRDWSGPAWSEWAPAQVDLLASSGAIEATTTTSTSTTTPTTVPATAAPTTAAPTTAAPTTAPPKSTTTVKATTTTTAHPTTTSTTRPPASTTSTTRP